MRDIVYIHLPTTLSERNKYNFHIDRNMRIEE